MKIVKYCLFLLMLVLPPALAAPLSDRTDEGLYTILGFIHQAMAHWKRSGTPVFFNQCLETREERPVTHYWKHMVIFPVGATKGVYEVFIWNRGEDPQTAEEGFSPDLTLKSRAKLEFHDEQHPFAAALFPLNAEFLLHSGVTLVYPKDFEKTISAVPKTACPPEWPVDYFDPEKRRRDIDKIYKDQKW